MPTQQHPSHHHKHQTIIIEQQQPTKKTRLQSLPKLHDSVDGDHSGGLFPAAVEYIDICGDLSPARQGQNEEKNEGTGTGGSGKLQ